MATTSLETSCSVNEVKHNAEEATMAAATAGRWKLIHGDLAKLLEDENSLEYVIYEKIVSDTNTKVETATDAADVVFSSTNTGAFVATDSNNHSLESKNAAEVEKIKPLQIIVCRQETIRKDLSQSPSRDIPTGKKPVSVFILFSNGKTSTKSNSSYPQKLPMQHPRSEYTHTYGPNDPNYFFHVERVCMSPISSIIEESRKLTTEKTPLDITHFSGYVTEYMRAEMLEELFDAKQKQGFIDAEDCQFLKMIAPHRAPSLAEKLLNQQLVSSFNDRKFKDAIEIARKLHALSRKEAKERGTSRDHSRVLNSGEESTPKLEFLDDCNAAFELGLALQGVLEEEENAISAFEILLLGYHDEEAFEEYYQSAYYHDAEEKIADIRTAMLGSSKIDPGKRRELRRKAIESTFDTYLGNETVPKLKNLIRLMESQMGNETANTSELLFDFNTLKALEDENTFPNRMFLEMMLAMADKSYELRKKVATPMSSNAADVKSNMEVQLQKNKEIKKETETVELFNATSVVKSTPDLIQSEIKQESEKAIIADTWNWKLSHGDLDKLLEDENSTEYVIYEKNVVPVMASASAKAPIVNSSCKLSENKTSAEETELRPLQIIVCRQQTTCRDMTDPTRQAFLPGRRPISVFILLGDGKTTSNNLDKRELHNRWSKKWKYSYDPHAPSHCGSFCASFYEYDIRSLIEQARTSMGRKEQFEASHYVGLVTGYMTGALVEQYFDVVQQQGYINDEDCQFLKRIGMASHRQPSEEETKLNRELELSFNAGKFKKAIEIAKELHKLSRKEARERGTRRTSGYYGGGKYGPEKLTLLDDCAAALKLGNALELVSAEDALSAFKIISEYETGQTYDDAIYESPYQGNVKTKVPEILTVMLGSPTLEREKIRPLRRKALELTFDCFFSGNTEPLANFVRLMESHIGNETVDNSQLAFKLSDLTTLCKENLDKMFLNMMLTMADKIYELKEKLKLTEAPLTTAKSGSATSQGSTSMTYAWDSNQNTESTLQKGNITSLDEDEDKPEEVALLKKTGGNSDYKRFR